jgi:stearoyl-CoA desaturase (delta-9 desaturase)
MNVASTVAAVVLCFWFHSVSAIIAFLVMYTICGLGLTLGYHRLFAHRAFLVPKWLERLIAVCGYLAVQRGPIFWVATHRKHHLDTDVPGRDPHTPEDGLGHVHFGWVQRRREDIWDPKIYRKFTPDLIDDPVYLWMDHESHDYLTSIVLVFSSFVAGGLIGEGFRGFNFYNGICFVAWVGLLNRVALLQAFGLINSVCHWVGSRPFKTTGADRSANNLLVALIIFGEGWHNNHHAFPSAARQGLRWYQPDVAWYVIWALKRVRLATNVRLASPQAMARKAVKGNLLSRAGHV